MSERTFFNLRYALPGYTFILMLILVAYPELDNALFQKEQVALFAAFLTFFSLLGGSAIGFLVSQIWYQIFNRKIMANYEGIPKMIEDLAEKYELRNDRYQNIVFADYLFRLNESEGLKGVVRRRYDLMHLCGSTVVLTIFGSVTGACARIYLVVTRTGELILDWPRFEGYDYIVSFIAVALVILLFVTLRYVEKLHAMPFEIAVNEVVNSRKFPKWKARNVFPPHYFRDENGNDSA